MVKVFFPNMYIRLISANTNVIPHVAKIRVSPRMTKNEVREYLYKIYNITATKVHTTLFLGKWKRLYGKREIIAYKRKNDKKVTLEYYENGKKPTIVKEPVIETPLQKKIRLRLEQYKLHRKVIRVSFSAYKKRKQKEMAAAAAANTAKDSNTENKRE